MSPLEGAGVCMVSGIEPQSLPSQASPLRGLRAYRAERAASKTACFTKC